MSEIIKIESTPWEEFLSYVMANNLTVEQCYHAIKAYQAIEALKDKVKEIKFDKDIDMEQLGLPFKQ